VLRVEQEDFNEPCQCRRCGRYLELIVSGFNLIPFDCPYCKIKLETYLRKAGRWTRCPDCDQRIRVPECQVIVQAIVKPKRAAAGTSVVEVLGWIAVGCLAVGAMQQLSRGGGLAGLLGGPRLCSGCGLRYVRNPTDYCYQCRH
jgi:hypothetical protein